MNALAQNVTKLSKDYEALKKKCRQQQAEIEALKNRELTDEEIISTMVQFDVYSNDDQCLIEAGKAILRKAQEK